MSIKSLLEQYTCFLSILACISLTVLYVSSLYVWKSTLNRDHPTTIKKRFFSVFCMMLFAPVFVQYFLTEETLSKGDMYEQMGLRFSGFISASIFPLLLTVILFIGPLTMQYLSGVLKLYSEPIYWLSCLQDLVWLRNQVMAPLSEEWVFRACMMPLLLQCLDPVTAVFVDPLLFGIAHFHHMYEQMKAGYRFKTALVISGFQFMYTTLFGIYSAYIFIRTRHFVAPLLAHMFCNHMGFPNFGDVMEFPILQRVVIMCSFVLGLGLWFLMLTTLTNPEIYDNRLHYVT